VFECFDRILQKKKHFEYQSTGTRARPAEIAVAAAEDAADIFERQLPDYDAPKVEVIGNTSCT